MAGGSKENAATRGGATTTLPSNLPIPSGVDGDDEASLGRYLGMLWDGRWLILAAMAVAAMGLVGYLAIATPVYQSDVLIQIEQRRQAGFAAITDLPTALAGPQSQVDTEIEVLQSRRILGGVVESLNLEVSVVPRYFPVIGYAWARRHHGPRVSEAPWGLSRYAWGGEVATVSRFDVPEEAQNGPLDFTLVAGDANQFELQNEAGTVVAVGQVGKLVQWNMPVSNGEGTASLFVQELRARSGTEFTLRRVSIARAIERLRGSLRLAEKGRKTGMIQISLRGASPSAVVTTLDRIAQTYLRHNVELRSGEAQRTLEFLGTQIPILRDKLHDAETALEQYKSRAGGVGVDLSAATKATLDRTVEMEKRLSEMELQRKELLYRFTAAHPAIRAVDEKVAQLRNERTSLNEQIRELPEAESASLRLMRDVKVANELYVTLLNKAQELEVMKSGLVGNAHVLDLAVRAEASVSPNKARSAIIAFSAGLLLGIALIVARRALHQGIMDPADVEKATGLIVRASVPLSESQAEIQRKSDRQGAQGILIDVDPQDLASESLRSLRTSLQFALVESTNHIIALGGPGPGVGKSFIALNLAGLFSAVGKRVILVDADLRRGSLHSQLGVRRAPGLAEAIAGGASIPDVTRTPDTLHIDFIPRGASPSNPSELLGSERFRQIMEDLAHRYDIVLVDLPPILAVTDAALVGRLAGVNLLVLRAGWHPIREVRQAVKAYADNGVLLSGVVFNGLPRGRSGTGSNAYQYQYHYQYRYSQKDDH